MSTLEFILTMLDSDGISEPRKLMYLKELRKLESDSFVSGKHFVMDGKGGVVPGSSSAGLRHLQEGVLEWSESERRIKQENLERYSD